MERTEGTPRPPLSAEHDADCSKKADDTSEAEEEELHEEGDESLHKNQGGQTSISEKQMTADEKCSEEVDQDELKEVISLPPKYALSLPVFGSLRKLRRECRSSLLPQHQKGHRPVPQGGIIGERTKEQATHNILPYPGQVFYPFYSPTSNWNIVQSPYIPSHERLPPYLPPPYLQINDTPLTSSPESIVISHSANPHGETLTPGFQSANYIPNMTAGTDSDWRKETVTGASSSLDSTVELMIRKNKRKYSSTAAYPTPGHSQDNTRGTALYATAGPSTVPLSTKDDKDSDPAAFYDREKGVELFGRKYLPSYSPSSLSQIPSAKKRALTQAENVSVMPLDLSVKHIPEMTADTESSDSDCNTSEHNKMKSAVKHERKSKIHSSRWMKKMKNSAPGVASTADSSDYTLDRPSPGSLRETVIKSPSTAADATPGHSQDNTRETELHATAGPSTLQHLMDLVLALQDTDYHHLYFDNSSYSSTVHTAGSGENFNDKPQPSDCEAAGDSDALVKMEAPVTAVSSSVTNTQPTRPHLQLSSDPGRSQRGSSCLPRSHSVPSLSQISSAENKTFRPSESLPDLLLKSSFEEFTPDITVDENDETYRFLCSCPGLYQCSVTGLVFHMEGEGHVVYRIVSWDRRLLAQHHKKPAGPLFDIKCLQQSVCRLHLPHCEIRSTAGCEFLSVAHVKDESIEFIPPQKITETHVIINITGFSGFGNVKDEDSPPEPVRALVLLFYRPLSDQNLTSFLNVLMLPRNVVLRDVRRTRKKLVGDEFYIETSPQCKLLPKQEYTLSTCPEDDSVLVQPKEAEFDEESYDNYFPSFQVTLKTVILNMKTLLRDTNSSHIVWEREVCLPSAGLKRPCVQGSSDQILKDVRISFIEGISGPVLKSLLDKLFEKKVLTDSERESADEMQNREEKARFVIDTVRRKGEAASSEMIEFLCKVDPFLCKHLGLNEQVIPSEHVDLVVRN